MCILVKSPLTNVVTVQCIVQLWEEMYALYDLSPQCTTLLYTYIQHYYTNRISIVRSIFNLINGRTWKALRKLGINHN